MKRIDRTTPIIFSRALGFAYKLDDRTVLRGGSGRYYGDTQTNMLSFTYSFANLANIEYTNDGRADFFRNPWNGPKPTRDGALPLFCSENGNQPGCLLRSASELAPYPATTWTGSRTAGRRRSGSSASSRTMLALEVDYVQTNTRNEKTITGNINLAFNPATGENFPYSNRALLPFPDWGIIGMTPLAGWSDFRGLQMAFTKRFSNRWQASGNFLLSQIKDSKPNPIAGLTGLVPFDGCAGSGRGLRAGGNRSAPSRHAQRHLGSLGRLPGERAVLLRFRHDGCSWIPAPLMAAASAPPGITPIADGLNGEIVPRNNYPGPNMHRVDMRFQQRIPVGPRLRLDGQLEVFNLFNRFNPSSYVTNELNIRFGQPNESDNIAYRPRVMQLGFRMTF